MNIVEATRRYEAWLISSTFINQRHLLRKHELMKEGVFNFLRASFYRWTQLWPEICPDLRAAPRVLAVGDLHIENFGTWRDNEGRLVWGVNDFDEAYPLPYTNDLVRLAASAMLANSEQQLSLKPKEACGAILSGYVKGLEAGGQPFVLEEDHKNLRTMAFSEIRSPRRFWKRLMDQDKVKDGVPTAVSKLFEDVMPATKSSCQFLWHVSGLGSLGRFRVVAVTEWHGGKVAREVKALAPSACLWARSRDSKKILYRSILGRAVRSHDPFVQVRDSWLIRRLSPHCCRIEMNELPKNREEYRLLQAMGWETANIHFGNHVIAGGIKRDLAKREASWLRDAAKAMAKATACDWKDWKKS
jgi:hypothetical protein